MENNNDYLAHHGIKGQKWGVTRTPEQLGHTKKLRPKKQSKKESYLSTLKTKLEKRQAEKKAAQAEQKAAKKAEEHEKLKEELRNHPSRIYRHRNELTEDDVNDIMKKVNFDQKCKDIRTEQFNRGMAKIRSAQQNIKTFAELLNSSVGLYNNTAMIYNGFIEMQKRNGVDTSNMKPMPKVGWDNQQKQQPQQQKPKQKQTISLI